MTATQNKLLGMMKYFHKKLQRNKNIYFLCGGGDHPHYAKVYR